MRRWKAFPLLLLSACGRIGYATHGEADAGGLDAPLPDAALPDAPGLDAPIVVPDAALDAPLELVDAAGPDASTACAAGTHRVAGRCVPFELDLDGDGFGDVVVGAQNAPPSAQGAAFFYLGSPTGPMPAGVFRSGNADERIGFTLLDAQDTNADGFDDILVSGHNFGSGQAYVFLGGSRAYATPGSMLTASPSSEFSQFMADVGDLDGDGTDDVAAAEDGAARVHLFRGSAGAGLLTTPSVTFTAPDLQRITSGDVSGDGLSDLVLRGVTGARGHLHVYVRTGTGFAASPITIPAPGASMTLLGVDVVALDGDDSADIVAGASDGTLLVYRGGALSTTSVPDLVYGSDPDFAALGATVAAVGDLDHDGFEDVAVAADVGTTTGVVVFRGGGATLARGPSITLPAASGRTSVTLGATDIDGDGEAELVVGDPLRQHVYFYASPLGTPSLAYDLSEPTETSFGNAIATR